jgi:integrase/recombinase XerD
MSAVAPTLEAYFIERLRTQRNASPRTVAAYRDTWRLLLGFVSRETGKDPSQFDFSDLSAARIGDFLQWLEETRHNTVRTRNARLAAIHAFFRYAAYRHPEHAALIQHVLAIPAKRFEQPHIDFLTEVESAALLNAVDQETWVGRRDYTLLMVLLQTGLRVSELTGLTIADVDLGASAVVRCSGKGRKQRATPLTAATVATLKAWLTEWRGAEHQSLFPTVRGHRLSTDAIQWMLTKYEKKARVTCPTLARKHLTPHVLRHTCAMSLLRSGVDITVIALWLGHESLQATQIYIHADMAIKEQAIARMAPMDVKPGRYQPPDTLLAFLESL